MRRSGRGAKTLADAAGVLDDTQAVGHIEQREKQIKRKWPEIVSAMACQPGEQNTTSSSAWPPCTEGRSKEEAHSGTPAADCCDCCCGSVCTGSIWCPMHLQGRAPVAASTTAAHQRPTVPHLLFVSDAADAEHRLLGYVHLHPLPIPTCPPTPN
jgi:hypothetical protein